MKRPEERPMAPAASPSSSSRRIVSCSAAVGARSSSPTVIARRVLCPTCMITFTAVGGNRSMYCAKLVSATSSQGAKPAR